MEARDRALRDIRQQKVEEEEVEEQEVEEEVEEQEVEEEEGLDFVSEDQSGVCRTEIYQEKCPDRCSLDAAYGCYRLSVVSQSRRTDCAGGG